MAIAPSLLWLFIGRVISASRRQHLDRLCLYRRHHAAERRAAVFGKIGAAFGAGFILARPSADCWAASIRACRSGSRQAEFCEYALWLADPAESLPPERRAPFRWKSANPWARWICCARTNSRGAVAGEFLRPGRACGAAVDLRVYATYRYGWDTTTVGLRWLWLASAPWWCRAPASNRSSNVRGTPRAVARACQRRTRFFIYGAAPTGPLFWIGIPVMALWGVAGRQSRR